MIKEVLAAIDENVTKQKPQTMEELLKVVHSTEGAGAYGTSYSIVKINGDLCGVRVYVTGTSKTHTLPAPDKYYAVLHDMEKFEKAGWTIEHQEIIKTPEAILDVAIGYEVSQLLDLKFGKDGRIKTLWGTKTIQGLGGCITRIVEEQTNRLK